jgi:Zn-finger nucleic acid-binding protein
MARTCPDCRTTEGLTDGTDRPVVLVPVTLEAPTRPGTPSVSVEIDRCASCGGVWFDYGEAEALTKRALPFEPLADAATSRRCPTCGLSLTPGLLPEVTTVEVCTACRGAWFDYEDLKLLQSRALESVATAPLPRPSQQHVGFVCASCGKAAGWAEANGTTRGLVCAACAPRIAPQPKGPLDAPDGATPRALGRLIAQVMSAFSKPSS